MDESASKTPPSRKSAMMPIRCHALQERALPLQRLDEEGHASATNTVKVYHVLEAAGLLIQPGHHFVFGERFKAGRFEIETPGSQIRTNVLRNELLVEINPNGEFYSWLVNPFEEEEKEQIQVLPCKSKSKSCGIGRAGEFGWRESGRRV
jgi:hypothetical protein